MTSFDPLACYWCGVHGHLARDYPSSGTQSLTLSGGSFGPTRGSSSKSGQLGPRRGRGQGRQTRLGGIGVVYDDEGYEYPIDDYGQLYVLLHPEEIVAGEANEEISKETKAYKGYMPVWLLLVQQDAQRA